MGLFPRNGLLPLCQLPVGANGRVRELAGDGHFCQRVREMGLGELAIITKIFGTGPFVCQVNGMRVALGHGAAGKIMVEQLG